VALDTVGPLLKTKRRSKYLLVVIDHYSKSVEAKAVANHDVAITIEFLESEVIYRHGVHKYSLMDNGFQRVGEFSTLFKD
jgi:hypothetical protein